MAILSTVAACRTSLSALRSSLPLRAAAQPVTCCRCNCMSSAATSLQRRLVATASLSSAISPPLFNSPTHLRYDCRSYSSPASASASASTSAPSSSTLLSRLSSVSFSDALLGFLCGVTVFYGVEWLLYWPDPLPSFQPLLDSDPLLQSTVGSPLRISPLWTGTVRDGDSFSVSLPVRGSKGSGRVFARGVFDSSGRQWKLVYLQASVGGLQQRHSLHIPPHMDVRGAASGTTAAAGALVMQANFNPTLLPPEQYVRYQQFLKQHNMREWKPEATEAKAEQSSEADSASTSSSTSVHEQTQPTS